jgi:two-component system alkaline phosphatase synthesis response regulator PhoP
LEEHQPTPIMKHTSRTKGRVLVVDDNADLLLTIKSLLDRQGYETFTAPDGAAALKVVLNREVDAVVCDLEMPHLEGNTFYATVERVAPHLAQSFIFMTGMAEDPRFREFFERVGCPVLPKPMESAKLLETLREITNREKDPIP